MAQSDASLVLTHEQFAMLCAARGDFARAVVEFERCTVLAPDSLSARYNLGVALLRVGDDERALAVFEKLVARWPDNVSGLFGFATALLRHGQPQRALEILESDVCRRARDANMLDLHGSVLAVLGRHADAASLLEEAVNLDPNAVTPRINLGNTLIELDRITDAQTQYRVAVKKGAGSGVAMRSSLLLPAIMESASAIHEWRDKIGDELSGWSANPPRLRDPAAEIDRTLFYLSYHDIGNRHLHETVARLYLQCCPALHYKAPHCTPYAGPGPRIRIGIISMHLFEHSIGKTTIGFVEQMDRTRFEVVVIFIPPVRDDRMSSRFRESADEVVVLSQNYAAALNQIAECRLDVLFYQDIGMEPFSYFLAFARLAPVQCVSFGHPDTTGIPTMDYFVSNDLFEPDGASGHYSEQLVELHDLPTLAYYHRPEATQSATRREFCLPEDLHVYLCPQALFKIHPDFDRVLAEILQRDRRATIALIESANAAFGERLRTRLSCSLGKNAGRVLFLPRTSPTDFLKLLSVPDVILDTPHFNGMNTSLEAFAQGTPVITCPGMFQRGRHTAGMYRKMELDTCVARDAEDYASIAVRIATDSSLRGDVSQTILDRSDRLFEDISVVRQFEQFFIAAVDRAHS